MAKVTICNKCGKHFDQFDEAANFGLHYKVGYGSIYDNTDINLDLCCDCFDSLMKYIIPLCKIDPVTDYE